MTRTLALTPAEWEVLQRYGTAWIVREASYDLHCPTCGGSASLPLEMTCPDHRPEMTPPIELVAAAAPCEACGGSGERHYEWGGKAGTADPCPDCRIILRDGLGCDDPGCFHVLGYAYAGWVLPIVGWQAIWRRPACLEVQGYRTVAVWTTDNDGRPIGTADLAHYGDLRALVGHYALKVRLA